MLISNLKRIIFTRNVRVSYLNNRDIKYIARCYMFLFKIHFILIPMYHTTPLLNVAECHKKRAPAELEVSIMINLSPLRIKTRSKENNQIFLLYKIVHWFFYFQLKVKIDVCKTGHFHNF